MNKSVALKLAGAAALASSSQAYGQIVPITGLSLPTDISTPSGGSGSQDFVEFYNVSTGVTTSDFVQGDDLRFEVASGSYYGLFSYFHSAVTPLQSKDAVVITALGSSYAAAIPPGTTIGSNVSTFSQGINYAQGDGSANESVLVSSVPPFVFSDQQPNAPTFLGFQFPDALGNIHDGYLEIETTYDPTTLVAQIEFLKGAYNSTADDGIGDGDIVTAPEPGTISSLVLGAAALGAVGLMRRRRSLLAQD